MIAPLDPEWLELRAPLDAAARSPDLASQFAAALPVRPRILCIGPGVGGVFRWLAPRIGRAQVWHLADEDDAPIARAFDQTAAWAARRGYTVTWPGRAVLVHTPQGVWRLEGFVVDLAAAPDGLPLDRSDALVIDALLERVSRAWLARVLERLRVPVLGCLVEDGRSEWLPRHAADRLIVAGLRRRLGRDSGFGAPLGASAPSVVAGALEMRGFAVRSAPSAWQVPRTELTIARRLVQIAAASARGSFPAAAPAIADWEALRLRQTLAARLAVRIGHRDILGLPRQR